MHKSLLAYSIVGYCLLLLGLCFWLSHYPWPTPVPDESAADELLLNATPPNFKAIRDIKARKAAFFAFLTPLIERENQRMLTLRSQLADIARRAAKGKLTAKDKNQLAGWMEEFGVEDGPLAQSLDRLDRRINTIPTAMALAQAASESAWGTSRFAREGNNYFGQWCFKAGCGLVPKRRREGASHEVTRFASAHASVVAYFHNINTHSAYHGLRLLRQEKAARGEPVGGYELVGRLRSYSERGAPYIEELRVIIRSNLLEEPPAASDTAPESEESPRAIDAG